MGLQGLKVNGGKIEKYGRFPEREIAMRDSESDDGGSDVARVSCEIGDS